LYEAVRKDLEEELYRLTKQRENRILEGYMLSDCIHILIEVLSKKSVVQVGDTEKEKGALHIVRRYGSWQRYFTRGHIWVWEYFVF